jgi:DNA-binding PadR family transcriptional regulator
MIKIGVYMKTIDLIVLGIIKSKSSSAYEIQKLVEYRKISRWVRISTPSIYKKVIRLEEEGLIKSSMLKEGNMAEKAIYSLTDKGEIEFEKLMLGVAHKPINIFLDFNAVIVNLKSLAPEMQETCIGDIENNVKILKEDIEENILNKEDLSDISETGMAVLKQQLILAQAIETWILSFKEQRS